MGTTSKKRRKKKTWYDSEKLNFNLQVSRLGFGCAGLSGYLSAPLSHEEGCNIIKQAFIKGITFFDSSDLYGADHDNEIMIGKVVYFE